MNWRETLSALFARMSVPRVTGTRVGALAAAMLMAASLSQEAQDFLFPRNQPVPGSAPVPADQFRPEPARMRVPSYAILKTRPMIEKSPAVPCGPGQIIKGSMLDCSADNSSTAAVRLDGIVYKFADRITKAPRAEICRGWQGEGCRPVLGSERGDFDRIRQAFATPPVP